MKKQYHIKKICILLLAALLITNQLTAGLLAFAADGVPSAQIDTSTLGGPRLTALTENVDGPTYQWQRTDDSNNYVDISGATGKYYDITEADYNRKIRVVVNGTYESTPTEPIGKLIVFDLSKSPVVLGATCSGIDPAGNPISEAHAASNIYVVKQSDTAEYTENIIKVSGAHPDAPFDLTLDGVHMGSTPVMNKTPDASGIASYDKGVIDLQPPSGIGTKHVTLRIKGENIVRAIRYSTRSAADSTFKITDINGDQEVSGVLYVPVKKVTAEEINTFVNSNISYNHWNSGIGGDDSSLDAVNGFEIAGGKVQVLTTYADNCTAIGAGGNGPCTMTISGGEVTAHCSGTGAAIGGGIGWHSGGGTSNITITGGKVYAKNHGKIFVKATYNADGSINTTKIVTESDEYNEIIGGVAIGSGSSVKSSGSEGTINISGGTVEAYGTYGNGIGGGNSSSSIGGSATINITGGNITASSIGGGDSKNRTGGKATVTVDEPAMVTLLGGIGGGNSASQTGGEATITVNGGTMNCAGTIGGGTGGESGNGGKATVTVKDGTLTAKSIGGGTGGISGDGGAAEINIDGGDIVTGSIGGGTTQNPSGNLGYAKAKITDGDIVGQFLMFAPDDSQKCTFEMTGGRLHGVDTTDATKNYAMADGAAVYMDDPNGEVTLTGGTIENCKAHYGGAVYMTAGTFDISGTAKIQNCTATESGGAVYLGGGAVSVSGNSAITHNTANGNGGGIAIADGNYMMYGGEVSHNESKTASGGGIYVSSNNSDVDVQIRSGVISNNKANTSGGALSVVGDKDSDKNINVTIGVKERHFNDDGSRVTCDHKPDTATGSVVEPCPIMSDNIITAEKRGGAIYITGNDKAKLNIHCLIESGSISGDPDDTDFETSRISDFIKVEGGQVSISTSSVENKDNENTQNANFGNIQIGSTLYCTGGKFDIWGDMKNPHITEMVTVDITAKENYFDDHRLTDGYYKLLYYENFTDPVTNVTTGQYKEVVVPINGTETISGSIYSHPGYEIVGWNTAPDGSHDGIPSDSTGTGWFNVNETYTFKNDLVLYAIWEANGYTVIFDPNTETYTGEMDPQNINYDVEATLNPNQYGRAGYIFAGWSDTPDGEVKYGDQATVKNLTTVKGEKVTLYAKWTECNHDSSHEYTYSLINDETGIKKECSCKGYSETAVLFAENTVYNRGPHPAELTYSHDSWDVNIVYTKGGSTLPAGEVPTRAGTYTASITAGGKTASVTYMIDKATQPKPAQNPVGEVTSNSIAVKPIVSSPYAAAGYDENYKSEPEYRLVYYDQHGGEHTSEWVKGSIDSDRNAVVFPLDYALTNYYIYARYSECDDYYASDVVKSGAHFYPGNVRLDVICGEGVTYTDTYATEGDNTLTGIEIALQLEDGYYFPQSYDLSLVTNKEPAAVLGVTKKYEKYNISSIPTESVLTLTIPDAKKLPTIESKIIEKEVFGNFEDKTAKISGDSAFTTYFELKHYDSYYFNEPVLEFNLPLPKGTTLILQDRTTPSDVTYYSVTVGSATDKVSLTDFIRMGTADTHFSAESGDLKLQVAVDFSEAEAVYPVGSLNLTMGITSDDTTLTGAQSKPGTKIEISQTETADVTEKAGFALRYANEQIVLDYTSAEGVASKWDYRHTALILRLDSNETKLLPSDAYLLVTDRSVDGQAVITRVYKNDQKNFVVPIGAAADKNLDIALVSKTLAGGLHEFDFDATWISNHSEADGSPSNGEVIATQGFTLKANNPVNPSLKVTTENNTKLYDRSGTVNARIDWRDVKPTHEMTVTLMRKNDDTKEYASTGWSRVIDHNGTNPAKPYELEVPLAGNYSAGSYALQVTIDQGLVNVEKVNYYFIIK